MEGSFIVSVLQFLDQIREVFEEASRMLMEFSGLVSGPLSMHAVLASRRLSLIAGNLEHALRLAGRANVVPPGAGGDRGILLSEALKRLEESLRSLREAALMGSSLNLKAELERFESFLEMAENGFRCLASELEKIEDEGLRLLGSVLRTASEDIKIIRRRHRELQTLTP